MKRELIITSDGSHTLYVPEMQEHYHSVNGAIQESLHVYINAAYLHRSKDVTRLLEIGLGTGLNALLTWKSAEKKKKKVIYYSVERYPLSENIIRELNYGNITYPQSPADFLCIHNAPWEETVELSPYFSIHKMEGDVHTLDLPHDIDVIYYDAFAPDKQSDMWTQNIFDKLFASTNTGGVLTTYCAKGVIRRMMQQSGYKMERIPGPPGKREMLRATKE